MTEPAALPAVGVDIGGTKVLGGLVTPDGRILRTARRATPGASVSETEDAIAGVVADLLAGNEPVVGVGVGAAGWFDRTGDTVLFSPHLAWRHATLRKDLAARVQLPLWVGNDADAAAWAEYRYGAARGADLALMITSARASAAGSSSTASCAAARTASRASGATCGSSPTGGCARAATAAAGSSTPAARRSARPRGRWRRRHRPPRSSCSSEWTATRRG